VLDWLTSERILKFTVGAMLALLGTGAAYFTLSSDPPRESLSVVTGRVASCRNGSDEKSPMVYFRLRDHHREIRFEEPSPFFHDVLAACGFRSRVRFLVEEVPIGKYRKELRVREMWRLDPERPVFTFEQYRAYCGRLSDILLGMIAVLSVMVVVGFVLVAIRRP